MNRIEEIVKHSVALASQSLATTNKTGDYILAGRRNLYTIVTGGCADAVTIVAQVYQGTSVVPAASKVVTSAACTITATTNVQKMNLLVDTVTNGKIATINGISYTKAAAYSYANKEFVTAADVVLLINGYQGDTLYAVADGTSVLISGRNPGFTKISYTGDTEGAKLVPTVLYALSYISLDSGALDLVGGYKYIALKVTTVGTCVVGAILEQSAVDNEPLDQYAAASRVQPNL